MADPFRQQESGRPVVLVHGLWMVPAVMAPLGWRLRRWGFVPYRFGYPSRRHRLAAHGARLDAWLAERFIPGQGLAFVGHSLGGLVLRALAAQNPHWFEGSRTVILGSPNRGSVGAQFLMGSRLGRWWLGEAGRELAGEEVAYLPRLPGEVGVLAGTTKRWWTDWILKAPNDGMVRVSEVVLPEAELRLLRLNHLGLIFRRSAVEAIAHFLREGCFGVHGEPFEGQG